MQIAQLRDGLARRDGASGDTYWRGCTAPVGGKMIGQQAFDRALRADRHENGGVEVSRGAW